MKGIIWSCDKFNDGVEKLKYIRDRYYFAGINSVNEVYHKYGSGSFIEFENGDLWRVASATESSRGVRANIAWVDSRVDEEFFQCVIKHTLCNPFGPRYYEFYNAKE